MGKIDYILSTDTSEYFTSGLVKNGFATIMVGLKLFSFKDSPYSLGNVKERTIRWQEKEIGSTLYPCISHLGHLSFLMNEGIVKDDKCRLNNFLGKIIKVICEQLPSYVFGSVKSVIVIVKRHHSEDVESLLFSSRDEYILVIKLPTIRHISRSAGITLISKPKVYQSNSPKYYKLLQLKRFEIYQLWRGNTPCTYSYTFISCANNSKKRLNVVSLTLRLQSSSHFVLAVFMLNLCFRTVSFTASLSAELISGFAPRPPFSHSPSNPSDWYCLNHRYIASLLYPTNSWIYFMLLFSAFIRMALHRIRNQWCEPKRYALSSADFCYSLNIISFVFPIMSFPIIMNTRRDMQKLCHIAYF